MTARFRWLKDPLCQTYWLKDPLCQTDRVGVTFVQSLCVEGSSVVAMDGSLSFFEIGVADTDKARTFYGQLFGWTFVDEKAGSTIETPNIPGGLHGDDPGASPYLFFRVSDLSAALERVRALGGSVGDSVSSEDDETVARMGRFVICTDDQGSSFGLHQLPA